MKKFTQKNYGKRENIVLGMSTAGLGLSAANFATNLKRRKSDKDYQEKQLKAMDELTNSLNNVDNSLKKFPILILSTIMNLLSRIILYQLS